MSLFHLLRILAVLAYALLPYLLCVRIASRQFSSTWSSAMVMATALFILCSAPVVAVSLHAYLWVHAGLCVLAIGAVLAKKQRAGAARLPRPAWDMAAMAIVGLTILSRLIPPLIGSEPLGMGDARYHNMIAQALLIQDKSATTWEPFANIELMYPQAIHTLMAFVATLCHLPVHDVFVVMFAPVAGLTAFIIYRITAMLTQSVSAGRWAAAAFAFLPTWNSLDYYAWGGLPNALGMVFLLEVIAITLSWIQNVNPLRTAHCPLPTACLLPPAILLATIPATHHYTVLVTGLYLASLWICCGSYVIRKHIIGTGLLALLASAYALIHHYVMFTDSVGNTGVFVYREQITRLMDIVQGVSIPLTVIFILILLLRRHASWPTASLTVLAWLVSLLISFGLLAHGYRAATLWMSHGQDMFTAFTPSRMAATLIYPMSILSGLLVLTPIWQRHKQAAILCMAFACVSMTTSALSSQIHGDEFPSTRDASQWIAANTPTNAMLVGVVSHLEYAAWRETSQPPLPASERRHDPAVTWKTDLKVYEQWLAWEKTSGRPVYFLLPPLAQPIAALVERYTNTDIVVYSSRP